MTDLTNSHSSADFQRNARSFIEALREGERAIQEGRVRPAEQAFEEMKSKYDF